MAEARGFRAWWRTLPAVRRVGWCALATYLVLTVISIVAFHVMVGAPVPAGFDQALWAAGYAFGMKYMGALMIYVGFLGAVAAVSSHVGLRRGLGAALAIVAITLTVELIGAATGFPFGDHGYGGQLGWLVLGLVPFVIPLSWFLMLVASLGMALRFGRGTLATLAITAAGLFAWDVLMEPAMSAAYPFWVWRSSGVYFGMPLANWLSWLVIGPIIALTLLRIAGPGIAGLARDPLAPWLYALTGLLPLALALEFGLYLAALVGGGAMALYLVAPRLPRVTARSAISAPAPETPAAP